MSAVLSSHADWLMKCLVQDKYWRPVVDHFGITGPTFPNLKLPDGTDADDTWYIPYQSPILAADLAALGW